MPRRTVSRRRFLTIAAGGLGAGVLACSGLTALGSSQPAVDLPEMTLGDAGLAQAILVAYASTAGATAGVAAAIGCTLAESGLRVDVRHMRNVTDVTRYQAVVAGSAIHGSAWLPEAMQFMRTHQAALARRPFAAFLVCMTLTMANETYRRGVNDFMQPVRALVKPVSEGQFAGALDVSKLKLIPDGLTLRAIVASGTWAEGEHRDWDAIRAWAGSLKPLLAA